MPLAGLYTKCRIYRDDLIIFFGFKVFHGEEIHLFNLRQGVWNRGQTAVWGIISGRGSLACIVTVRTGKCMIQLHKISAFPVWSNAVVDSCKVVISAQYKRNFCLISAGPVGESIAVLDKLLCQECFGAGGADNTFFAGQELVRGYLKYTGAESGVYRI